MLFVAFLGGFFFFGRLTKLLFGPVQIADFGMSRVVEDETKRGQTATTFGPVPWMVRLRLFELAFQSADPTNLQAPEAIGSLQYSPQSDTWSLGVAVRFFPALRINRKEFVLSHVFRFVSDLGACDWTKSFEARLPTC